MMYDSMMGLTCKNAELGAKDLKDFWWIRSETYTIRWGFFKSGSQWMFPWDDLDLGTWFLKRQRWGNISLEFSTQRRRLNPWICCRCFNGTDVKGEGNMLESGVEARIRAANLLLNGGAGLRSDVWPTTAPISCVQCLYPNKTAWKIGLVYPDFILVCYCTWDSGSDSFLCWAILRRIDDRFISDCLHRMPNLPVVLIHHGCFMDHSTVWKPRVRLMEPEQKHCNKSWVKGTP